MIELNGNSNVKATPATEKRGAGVCGETTVNNLPQLLENEIRIDELDRLEVHADLPHLLDYVLRRYEELEK